MALTKCNVPSNVIGSLATRAEERGLSTQAFKDKFDEMPEGIKQYINEVLTEEIDDHMAENVTQGDTPHGMGKIAAQDYEEGVWTPTLKGSEEFNENTYGARMGWYVKKGNEVTVYMRMSVPSVGSTMQGVVHIYGLPFVSRANTRSSAGTFYGGRLKWKATWKQIGAGQLGDTDYVRLFAVLDNAEQDDLTAGDFTNGFFLNLSLSYLV